MYYLLVELGVGVCVRKGKEWRHLVIKATIRYT
jgi:hypothetical protein